jgi:hypothetical protein
MLGRVRFGTIYMKTINYSLEVFYTKISFINIGSAQYLSCIEKMFDIKGRREPVENNTQTKK